MPSRMPQINILACIDEIRYLAATDACIRVAQPILWLHRGPLQTVGEAKEVLVLSRKIGERILIGDKITVTVVKIGHGGVRIGVDAPTELAVVREELAAELRRVEQALAAEQAEPVAE
jgi:carbon storage regulator